MRRSVEQKHPPPAAPEAAAVPRPEETQGMRLEREARDLAAAWQSLRQLGQPLGEGGLSSGSNVEDMRHWLKTLDALVGFTKPEMWPRLVHAEARRELQKRDEAWLADLARELTEAGGQGELRVSRRTIDRCTSTPRSHTPTVSTVVCMVRNRICNDQWQPRIQCAQHCQRSLMTMRISERCAQHSSNGWRMRKQF